MSVLEFVLWILHIISALISIVVMIAVGYHNFVDLNWFEEWIEKNEISPFIEKLLFFIGSISILIAFVTGMILDTIVVK